MLYHTLIYTYLVYCNIAWESAKVLLLHKLLILQKRAVRSCPGSSFRSSSNPLFTRLNLLTNFGINNLHIALFMFKFKNNLLPVSCTNHIAFRMHWLVQTEPMTFVKRGLFQFRNHRRTIKLSIAICDPISSLPNNIINLRGIGSWNIQKIAKLPFKLYDSPLNSVNPPPILVTA